MKAQTITFFNKHAGSLITLALSTLLTLFLLQWLGFDLRYLGTAYMGKSNDVFNNIYYLYQAFENMLNWPMDLGNSLLMGTEPNSFIYTPAAYGVALPYIPIYILSGHNYLLVYNLHVIVSFVLTGWSAFLLIRHLFNSRSELAILGALILTFSPYRLLHLELAHPESISTHYFLFALYALHRMIDDLKLRWTILLVVSLFLTLTASGYYAIIFAIMGGIIVLFTLVKRPEKITRKFILHGIMATVLVLTLSFPFISIRFGSEVFIEGQTMWAKIYHSASVENFISGTSLLYRNRLLWEGENTSFLGVIPIGLTLFVWLKYRELPKEDKGGGRTFSSEELFSLYLILFIVGTVLSLGPRLKTAYNLVLPIPMPYALLMNLPGLNSMRAIVRFVMMPMIASSFFSVLGLSILFQKIKKSWMRQALFLLVTIGLFVEFLPPPKTRSQYIIYWPENLEAEPMSFAEAFSVPVEERIFYPVFPPTNKAINLWLAEQPPDTLVWHYPYSNLEDTHYSGLPLHKQPMVNGGEISAFEPEWSDTLTHADFPSTEALDILREHETVYVLVYLETMREDQKSDFYIRLEAFEDDVEALPLVGEFDGVAVYEVLLHE